MSFSGKKFVISHKKEKIIILLTVLSPAINDYNIRNTEVICHRDLSEISVDVTTRKFINI